MTKDDFSPEEWKLIVSAPMLVGVAVSAASPSGPLGVAKELFAVGSSIAELGRERPDNALIQAVVEDVRRLGQEALHPDAVAGIQDARAWAVNELGRVSELLPADDDDAEAFEFRRWLVAIAERVAEAAREGGFLGIGGDRVSQDEEIALNEITTVLGVT